MVIGLHVEIIEGFPEQYAKNWGFFFDGGLGVKMFFVLSGFLITYLLIGEEDKYSRISLKNFYARRALRILPVYFAFLLIVWVLTKTTQVAVSPKRWLVDITFTRDFVFFDGLDSHLWSLAVEEQFYLIWPLVLCYSDHRVRVRVAVALMVAATCFRALFSALHMGTYVHFSFFSNMDALMSGCLASILIRKNGPAIIAQLDRCCLAYRCGCLAGIYAVCILQRFYLLPALTITLGMSLQNICIAVLLVSLAYVHRGVLFGLLNHPWMIWFGVLSYSLYIWQELFVMKRGYYSPAPAGWMSFPWVLVAVLLVSCASYYLLELPSAGRSRRTRPAPGVMRLLLFVGVALHPSAQVFPSPVSLLVPGHEQACLS